MIRSELNTAKKLNSIFDIVISDLTHKKILQKKKNESFPVFNFPSLAIPKKVNFKRNKNKGSYPSKLDNLVGCGQPTGLIP